MTSVPRSLEDYLAHHDEDFVRVAYRYLLNREPDEPGMRNYLALLRSGALGKLDLLGALRYSPEGRSCGVSVRGFRKAYLLSRAFHIPILGYILKLLYVSLRLPLVLKNIESFEAYTFSHLNEATSRVAELEAKVGGDTNGGVRPGLPEAVAELQRQLTRLVFTKADRSPLLELAEQFRTLSSERPDPATIDELSSIRRSITELEHQLSQLDATKVDQRSVSELTAHLKAGLEAKADLQATEQSLSELRTAAQLRADEISNRLELVATKMDVSDLSLRVEACEASKVPPAVVQQHEDALRELVRQLEGHKHTLLHQDRRLSVFFEQARKRMPEPFSAEQIREIVSEDDHFLDALYVSFEDRFRGTRRDIKDRCRVFLPFLRDALRRSGNASVLDVACGRGEWLELLQEEGIPALGVDFNRVMVAQCAEFGFSATQGDALDYLRHQKSNSLSAVSSFHFIEHVPLRTLVSLMDEILRVLAPGGLAIFETPNARNLLVTAGDFYRDPTHTHPVFPDTLVALAEYRGFADSTAYCFNSTRTALRPLSEISFNDLADYVSVSRDVVWMGTKSA